MNDGQATARTTYGQYAGFVTRLIAFLLDRFLIALCIAAGSVGASLVLQALKTYQLAETSVVSWQATAGAHGAAVLLFSAIYDLGFWLLAGQTPGKSVMGVRIVRTDGQRIRLGAALRRWLGYWLSSILFLGFLLSLVDNKRQALHDKLAGTLVVYTWPEGPGLAGGRPIRDRIRGLRGSSGDGRGSS
jgi:uncharacterized RDD family membrane protein YckC